MPTITKTLLASNQNGFAFVSKVGFPSASVGNYYVQGSEPGTASPNSYSATFRQGAATNTYADWGVPAGAVVSAIKLLSATGAITEAGTGTAQIQFWTDEADLGSYDVNSIGPGSSQAISKVASDYVRVQIDINANIDFDPFSGYGPLSVQVSSVQIEVTYSNPDQTFADSSSSSDAQSVSGTVDVVESIAISESLSLDGTYTQAENVSITDANALEGDTTQSDSSSTTDAMDVSGTVNAADNVGTSELQTIIDVTGGTLEDYTEGANVSESVEIIPISYQFDDGVQIGDVFDVSGTVTYSENIAVSDSNSFEASLVTSTDTFVDAVQDANYL